MSLLASAGITTNANVHHVPLERHESVARVIREAVTNVLRHSRASMVDLTYAGDELVVANDGVVPDRPTGSDGSGLNTLADQLAGRGAQVTSGIEGDRFVVRVQFAPAVAASAAPSRSASSWPTTST